MTLDQIHERVQEALDAYSWDEMGYQLSLLEKDILDMLDRGQSAEYEG